MPWAFVAVPEPFTVVYESAEQFSQDILELFKLMFVAAEDVGEYKHFALAYVLEKLIV